jgi:hypothetical protein
MTNNREKNEEYFARLGNENEIRPDHLPPNQGGKYTGFGNPACKWRSEARRSQAKPAEKRRN